MALEDLAEFRALAARWCCTPPTPTRRSSSSSAMADYDGISYLRSTRGGLPTLYGPDEEFKIGGVSGRARVRR